MAWGQRFSVCLLAVICLLASGPVRAERLEDWAKRTQTALEARVKGQPKLGLVVGLVDPKGTRLLAAGRARPDPTRLFEIGSVSKVFTGLCLGVAVSRNQVKLDDPVTKYLPPDLRPISPQAHKVTLLDLVTHTSGLPTMPDNLNYTDSRQPYADYGEKELLAYLKKAAGLGKGRGKFNYSNPGSGLLGYALARRAGTSYPELVRREVCEPLGLEHTGVELPPELMARLAPGHNAAGQPMAPWVFGVLAGCGALKSTPADLMRFVAANLGLVKTPLAPVLALAQKPQRQGPGPPVKVGLGWMVLNLGGRTLVFHDGGTGGHRAFVGLDPEPGRGVVVLCNTSVDVSDLGLHLLEPRIPLRQPRRAVVLPREALQKYVGRYRVKRTGVAGEAGAVVKVSLGKKGLIYHEDGQEAIEILPTAPNEFFYPPLWDAGFSFVKDKEGRVTTMVIRAGAQRIEANKFE